MWQGGNLFDAIIEFIKKEKPDIIALQEVYNGHNKDWKKKYRSIDVLKQELDYNYCHFAPAFLDNKDFGQIEQGNAILSKFPIIFSKVTFYDSSYRKDYEEKRENFLFAPRNLQQVTIDLDNQVINVFNTQGIWGEKGRDNIRRLEMSKTIIQEIKDKQNVILAGDFNVESNTNTIYNIEKYLTNVFKNKLKTSFNMKRKIKSGFDGFSTRSEDLPGYAKAVVDMIFISFNIKIIDYKCPVVDISDHLPLLTTLEI